MDPTNNTWISQTQGPARFGSPRRGAGQGGLDPDAGGFNRLVRSAPATEIGDRILGGRPEAKVP